MTKTRLFGLLALGGLAALVSCDNGQGPTAGQLDANDCPFGTFRPMGLTECVFPANDLNGLEIGVSDNRCAAGQPAIPPQCVSDAGLRAYLSTSDKCAPGYRFLEGSCERGTNTGTAGFFGTGTAGVTGAAGFFAGGGGTIASGGSGVCPDGFMNVNGFCVNDPGASGAGGSAGDFGGAGTIGAAGIGGCPPGTIPASGPNSGGFCVPGSAGAGGTTGAGGGPTCQPSDAGGLD